MKKNRFFIFAERGRHAFARLCQPMPATPPSGDGTCLAACPDGELTPGSQINSLANQKPNEADRKIFTSLLLPLTCRQRLFQEIRDRQDAYPAGIARKPLMPLLHVSQTLLAKTGQMPTVSSLCKAKNFTN